MSWTKTPLKKEERWTPAAGGACDAGTNPEVFFPDVYDDDAPIPVPSEVKELCAGCAFSGQCLEWAMKNDAYGFWAATSRFQRQQLGREQHRVKCPGCGSGSVMVSGRGEVCLACGISWSI